MLTDFVGDPIVSAGSGRNLRNFFRPEVSGFPTEVT